MIGERAGTCKFMGKGRMDTGTPIFWGSLHELLEFIFLLFSLNLVLGVI
jgi:hypothetical protein